MHEHAIYCDFDGTITAGETFVRVLKTYAGDLAEALIPQIHAFDLTLREGVTRMLETLPSEVYDEAIACADDVPLRPGLAELIAWARRHDIPFVVVSGGLEDMVRRKLGPLADSVTAIHAVRIDRSGPTWRVVSPYAGETELVDKVAIMGAYPARRAATIGDSTTDVRMSAAAEIAFARDRLQDQLDARGVPWVGWETFGDVRAILAERWGQHD